MYRRERDLRMKAEQERDYWKNEFYLMRKLRRAPVLKPIDKAIVEEFRHVEKWGQVKGPDGSTRANFKTIARNLHTSPDTVKRHAVRLEQLGLAEIREYQGVQDEHERKYIHVPDEKLRTVDTLEDPEQVIPKQGGNQYQCRTCGTTNVAVKDVKWLVCLDLTCKDYGKPHIIEPGEWRPQHVQNGHNKQKMQKQPAFVGTAAETAESAEPESTLRDDIPITPPVVPQGDLALDGENHNGFHSLTPDEREAAIDLHLAMSGGLRPIEMRADQGKKYTTLSRPLTRKQAAAHIVGTRTLGVNMDPAAPDSLAFCVDADDAAEIALLKEGAGKLAGAGFLPLIDSAPPDRPSQDGYHPESAHGWLIFDEPTATFATWAEVFRIAPEWAQIAERWPGEHRGIRSPGGKYLMPGYSAWSPLTSVSDGEVATNGEEAARLLLTHRSPKRLIPPLPPEPAPEAKDEPPEPAPAPGQGGELLEYPARSLPGPDVLPAALDAFEASHSWEDIFSLWSGPDRAGAYSALRGATLETRASVKPNRDGRTFTDYGTSPPTSRDKLGWWCRVRGLDEKAFKSRLCQDYRASKGAAVESPAHAVPLPVNVPEPGPRDDEATLDELGERLNYPRLELSPWSRVAPGRESWQKFKRFNPTKVAAMLAAAVMLL
jgi:hypothetical protein